MFHHFHGGHTQKIWGSLTADRLAEIIEFVGLERILKPEEWVERCLKGKLKEDDICITFDDCLLSQFEIAMPVLESYNLKAFFFIYSAPFFGELNRLELYRFFINRFFLDFNDFWEVFLSFNSPYRLIIQKAVEQFDGNYLKDFPIYSYKERAWRYVRDVILKREQYEKIMDGLIAGYTELDLLAQNIWMTNRHLQKLQKLGNLIGLHSYSHPTAMSLLSKEEQRKEYKRNFNHLSKEFFLPYLTASHPSSSYNKDTLNVLKDIGVLIAFSATMKTAGRGRYELPRQEQRYVQEVML
ncbi:MAG: hypothetical protein A2430_01990 [Candidatus Liptonbacteria bacterium RIFOXYC1_FULL_36_8]|uniref:NodB homology domain-containing protein n=3 Tax=Candidatus Liptoniibacteriota TaxID=1817909 RepID=A0A1G2CQ41_9BACT|nr:MAG: hypothetical protein A2390_00025 [Candidatus Liptonbacteria bacterium RIFOXYB1_FULL_36_10]OGZ03473.1 MAG: hypothetical protein A2604_00675 [Candidatus Liptonbacteria bacterium RIFOXYD1_FULL_36_11]OGZ03500.1 MAG: hypothetical protein A2430_01990 [Candidatus Liptonbacteria bacterium RIFOXYC1_FULL_36_8]